MIIKSVRYLYKHLKYGITNLIKWFPLIWNDRDFDYYFIFEVLKFKIKNTSKHIKSHNFHTTAQRDSEIMNICVSLIDKVQNDYYVMEHLDYPDLNEYFKKYPNTYKKIWAIDKDLRFVSLHIGQEIQEKSKRILFTLLERNIELWWD